MYGQNHISLQVGVAAKRENGKIPGGLLTGELPVYR